MNHIQQLDHDLLHTVLQIQRAEFRAFCEFNGAIGLGFPRPTQGSCEPAVPVPFHLLAKSPRQLLQNQRACRDAEPVLRRFESQGIRAQVLGNLKHGFLEGLSSKRMSHVQFLFYAALRGCFCRRGPELRDRLEQESRYGPADLDSRQMARQGAVFHNRNTVVSAIFRMVVAMASAPFVTTTGALSFPGIYRRAIAKWVGFVTITSAKLPE